MKTGMKILFLGANGLDTSRLRIPAELRDVKEELERAKDRKEIEVCAELAVRPVDLSRLLLDHRPDVVHFSGHGMLLRVRPAASAGATREFDAPGDVEAFGPAAPGVVFFEDDGGKAAPVPSEALTGLFALMTSQRCVVLNACFSAAQAAEIAAHVDCVIGMKRAIGDGPAVAFSIGFYRALVRGMSVKEAFELGKNTIGICDLPDADVPELHCREGVDPSDVRLVDLPRGRALAPAKAPKKQGARGKREWLVALGLLAGSFVAAGAWIAAPARLPRVSKASGAVVVVGPGVFSTEGREAAGALCVALDHVASDAEPRAVCRSRGLVDGDEALRERAISSGASVLVLVDDGGVARLHLLGDLAEHDRLSRGLPRVDLSRSGSEAALAPILRELARAADGAKAGSFDKARLRCGESVAQEALGVAVSTLVLRLYAPNCGSSREDLDALRPRCRGEECRILDMLDVAHPPAPTDCDREADENARFSCMRRQALQACAEGQKGEASRWLERLDAVKNPFYGISASEVAACSIAFASGLSAEERASLEARADRVEAACEVPLCEAVPGQCAFCAAAVGERAGFWAHAGDWARAERDYERAFRVSKDNEHLLGMVESRLHRFRAFSGEELAKKAAEDLKAMSGADAAQKVRAGLLAWVAAKREGNETYVGAAERAILKAYAELSEGTSVYSRERPDEVERALVCPRSVKACAVYDLLAVPKEAAVAERLREVLRGAGLPEE